MSTHYVYRVYDHDDRLIYVGSAAELFDRLDTHRATAWWAHQVRRVRAVVYSSKRDALSAETLAIRVESPRWNVKGRFGASAQWSKADFTDYLTALQHLPGHPPSRIRHMHQVGRMYRTRFNERIPIRIPVHPDGVEEDQWLDPLSAPDRLCAITSAINKERKRNDRRASA